MEQKQQTRSGKVFFLAAVLSIFAAILATLLLANDRRNLNLLLARAGFSQAVPQVPRSIERAFPVIQRGKRLPPPRMILPVHALTNLAGAEQRFVRAIQSDPRSLCERLRDGGFADLNWTMSSGTKDNWECSSLTTLDNDTPETSASSVFIFIKGNAENRVTSFRIKLNIEHPQDRERIAELASTAATIFLNQVRWENGDAVVDKIKALEQFDIRNFASRIQLKREYGDVPRYNFLASQFADARTKSREIEYFDRSKWFPLPEGSEKTPTGGIISGDGAIPGEISVPE